MHDWLDAKDVAVERDSLWIHQLLPQNNITTHLAAY